MQQMYKFMFTLIPIVLLSISLVSSAPAPVPVPGQDATVVDLVARNKTAGPDSPFYDPSVPVALPREPQTDDKDHEDEQGDIFPFPEEDGIPAPEDDNEGPEGGDNDPPQDDEDGDEEEDFPGDDEEEEVPSPGVTPIPSPTPSISIDTPSPDTPAAGAIMTTVYVEDGFEAPAAGPSIAVAGDPNVPVTVTVKVAQGWPEWDANGDGRPDDVLRAPSA